MSVLEKVRSSGKCPLSLLSIDSDMEFETMAVKVVDANELYLSYGPTVRVDFKKLLELTTSNNIENIYDNTGTDSILISRRAIILFLVASTPTANAILDTILEDGYLSMVKLWLDDILKGTLGGIDLLLYLLTNITLLPVTKSIVKESGMGKAVGSIRKHRLCVDSPHKVAIIERVNAIKDAWHKSVKIRKDWVWVYQIVP